jgi:DNA-binding transcriptional ArsR family regulator
MLSFNDFVEYTASRRRGMVNTMIEDQSLDRTYAALSDSTRRGLLVALRDGPARITDLAAPLPISFAAVARHVSVLESAGLIEREVRGREHWLSVRSTGLRPAEEWITDQISFWSARADALAARLERRKRQP